MKGNNVRKPELIISIYKFDIANSRSTSVAINAENFSLCEKRLFSVVSTVDEDEFSFLFIPI